MANFQTVPVVDQIETCVLRQQTKLHQYLADHQIVHEAWSPLGEGAGRLFNHPVLKDLAAKYAKLLYAQAQLIAGLPLADPAGYTELVCSLMK